MGWGRGGMGLGRDEYGLGKGTTLMRVGWGRVR